MMVEIPWRVSRYLAGATTLVEFEDWFLEATRSLTDESPAANLADLIHGLLMECRGGHMSETDFRSELAEAVHASGRHIVLHSTTSSSTTVAAQDRQNTVELTLTAFA